MRRENSGGLQIGKQKARQHVVMRMVAVCARVGIAEVVNGDRKVAQITAESGDGGFSAAVGIEIACDDDPGIGRGNWPASKSSNSRLRPPRLPAELVNKCTLTT